jgi:hypothetical protein
VVRSPSPTLRISDQATCPHQRSAHQRCRWQHPPGHTSCRGRRAMPAPPAFPSPDPTCPGTPKKVRGHLGGLGDHLLPVSWCCQSHGGGLTSSRLHAETEHGQRPRQHRPRDLYAGRQLAGAICPLYTKINGCKLTLTSGLGIRTVGIREPASTVISAAAWPEIAGH